MKGAFGSQVVLGDGVTLVFDEAYVRESLSSPQAKARPGYPPSMPSFEGLLKDREVDALIEYLESLH
jgi:cytochrome c oxidase subunit 2